MPNRLGQTAHANFWEVAVSDFGGAADLVIREEPPGVVVLAAGEERVEIRVGVENESVAAVEVVVAATLPGSGHLRLPERVAKSLEWTDSAGSAGMAEDAAASGSTVLVTEAD